MTFTHHVDWLYEKYGRHPDSILTVIRLADQSPFLTDAVGERIYRDRVVRLMASMVAIADDWNQEDVLDEFHQRFTAQDADAVKTFVIYLMFIALQDWDWPEQVIFDAVAGEPLIKDVDGMWKQSEALVAGLLAQYLSRGGQSD